MGRYITNSQVKFVLVLDEFSPREDALIKVGAAAAAAAEQHSRPWAGAACSHPRWGLRAAARRAAAAAGRGPGRAGAAGVRRRACRPQVFKQLHHLYCDATSNPFYTYGAALTSAAFEAGVGAIVSSSEVSSSS